MADDHAPDKGQTLAIDGNASLAIRTLARHPRYDLAILQVPTDFQWKADVLVPVQEMRYSAGVCAFGFPNIKSHQFLNAHAKHPYSIPLCRQGMLAGVSGENLIIDGHINPGMSGGPVVTDDGIVGVVAGYYDEEPHHHSPFMKEATEKRVHVPTSNSGLYAAVGITLAVNMIRDL